MRNFHPVAGVVGTWLLVLAGCATAPDPMLVRKIELDTTVPDAAGLRGPAEGKRSVSYEFAIPDTPACRAEVAAIDASARFMPGSRGRVGARAGECLVIGTTGPDARVILLRLAALPYVTRIIECHFE